MTSLTDPVKANIELARENFENKKYLPTQIITLLGAGALATYLKDQPFVSQIVMTLFSGSSSRFQERLLSVVEELDAQHKRIEKLIPDENYYRSEEFQTLFVLFAERLHATHQKEKLKLFGAALANSGREDFQENDKELYVRLIRDLSVEDLLSLKSPRLLSDSSYHAPEYVYDLSEVALFSRLAGLGLVFEQRHTGFGGGAPAVGQDRHYSISPLGEGILRFIELDSAS